MSSCPKEFFYAGRTGGDPIEIWYLCVFGDIIIASAHKIFKCFSKMKFLQSFCEIGFISFALYFLIFTQSPFFILLLLFLPHERENENEKRSGSFSITKLDVLFMTGICIIFVDFPAFPKRFAKVSHDFGFVDATFIKSENTKDFSESRSSRNVFVSLMDTGAAFFVILNGFTSMKTKNLLFDSLLNGALWGARRITTEATNYFTPEGEYSPGCNFFGYISIVQFVALIAHLLRVPSIVMFVAFTLIHECTNCAYPILGYVSLFFAANVIGYKKRRHFVLQMFNCFVIVMMCSLGIASPLREDANTSFSFFVISILCCTLDINYLNGISYDSLSPFMKAVDNHSLFFFLIANIITGTINLLFDTNNGSNFACFFCVNLTFIVSSVATMAFYSATRKIFK